MNIVGITGRLTADPELKTTASGTAVCTFDMAVQRPRKSDTTDFFTVTAWRGNAEFITRYFRKGQRIEVNGMLITRDWTDKQGNKRRAVEIEAEQIGFGESKRDSASAFGGGTSEASTPSAGVPTASAQGFSTAEQTDFEEITGDDELPF